MSDVFEPTRAAALARLAAVRPAEYARSRNSIEGAVTRLSPYLTHGLLELPEVLDAVAARHRLDVQHKFVFELGWREYFRHVWQRRGDGILHSLHEGPLPDSAYARALPLDIRRGATGVPAIDQAVRRLYATGYLHNHARMWLASYVVHLRKVHWRTGADWLFGHLLDGDLASNHLSWQWVAGTGSRKPYLFNAENVARYAPDEWHSPGSVIDTSYDALDALARQPAPVPAGAGQAGIDEPRLSSVPPQGGELHPGEFAGRDVWLVHPWALGDPPADLPADVVCLGWWPRAHHAAWPWSGARWAFVAPRLEELSARTCVADGPTLAQALAGARSVQTRGDPHVAALLPGAAWQRAPARIFGEVERQGTSFFDWWSRSTRGVKCLADLPGLAARAPGPLFDSPPPRSTPPP